MDIKSTSVILFLFLIANHAFAIDPVYDGPNGIRASVFATNCLGCHSSGLIDPARNGAPADVNFDTYESAIKKAGRAIVRAVEENSMPPANTKPLLNNAQKTALIAWQSAGFPKTAVSSFDGSILTVPVLRIGDIKIQATFRSTSLNNSPTGYGFVLDSTELTTAFSENPATFDPETGKMLLPSVELVEKGDSIGSGDAQMTWVAGSAPMVFTLDNPSFPIISPPATYNYSGGIIMTLPVVNVGEQKFRATLKSVPLLTSPLGVGFVLESAEPTTAFSEDAATFNPETGQVVLPAIKMIRTGGVRLGQMFDEMELVPGSNPLLFRVTSSTAMLGAPWYPSNPQ
ncbi:hypothetical protein [Methylobacter sp. YRD-M1]|uniref:hypothetical protein n=1 Tax=Methylobacter sp. YRD-M1 TaxID=2911520 RepID=UPI00227B968E|nr:hypothetical protein [Methylobacter sp. YRD-M1]WAK00953.1 hypothetical protein LZ558_14035 [Methylobacter sp. YRD-M1]